MFGKGGRVVVDGGDDVSITIGELGSFGRGERFSGIYVCV